MKTDLNLITIIYHLMQHFAMGMGGQQSGLC